MILPLLIAALAQLNLAQPTPPQPSPAKPAARPLTPGKYAVVKLTDDLDCEHVLRALGDQLDRARGSSLIILELGGNAARWDIVARLGARLTSSPVAVLLRDPADKTVGLGQALVGAFVPHCYIDADTRIVSGDDLRHLAPTDVNWESISQEITGPLWSKLSSLSADQALPTVLLNPADDHWAVPLRPGEPWKLATTPPAGGASGPEPRQVVWGLARRIELDAQAAVGLRLCTESVRSNAPILAHAGLSPRSARSNYSVDSGLRQAARTVGLVVDDARLAARRIETTLSLKAGASVEEHRRAGRSALDQIDLAAKQLDRVESLLAEYPEINRAPGSTTPRGGPWRSSLDTLRKQLEKHRTTARDFASR